MRKKILSILLACAMCIGLSAPAYAAEQRFQDVPTAHWAYAAVTEMAEHKVVNGYNDGSFHPGDTVKSVEFAAMVARLLFTDELSKQASISPWWLPCVEALRVTGVTENTSLLSYYSDGSWDEKVAEDTINRYDMAQIMYNTLNIKGLPMPDDTVIQAAKAKVADLDDVPMQYQDAVVTMYAMECLTGMDNEGNFLGNNEMQRDQACVVLSRLLKKLAGSNVLADSANTEPGIDIIPEQEDATLRVGDCIVFSFPGITDGNYKMNIKSSDTSIVEVIDDSYIMALRPGVATVTVNLEQGGSKGSVDCKITVVDADTPSPAPIPDTSNEDDLQAIREEMLAYINNERAKAGARPLVLDNSLCEAAQIRAQELTIAFSHDRPDGRDCYSVLQELNISYRAAGENIAAGQTSVSAVMNSWMNSLGHRANILDQRYTKIGIGLYRTDSGYGYHWVQTFAG